MKKFLFNIKFVVLLLVAQIIIIISVIGQEISTDFILTDKQLNFLTECKWWEDENSTACHHASHFALRKMAQYLHDNSGIPQNPYYPNIPLKECQLEKYGEIQGAHYVCDAIRQSEGKPCVMYAYGISNDWTFEEHLNNKWTCQGLLFDPTVIYPSILNEKNTFFSLGANMLTEQEKGGAGARTDQTTVTTIMLKGTVKERIGGWVTAAPSQLMEAFQHDSLALLKMDCEGCEYAIVRDIIKFRHYRFFQKVQQFTFEAHLSQNFMKSNRHLFYFGMLMHILFKEGFHLVKYEIGACAPVDEDKGCREELSSVSFPCGKTKMCHEYLFARVSDAMPTD